MSKIYLVVLAASTLMATAAFAKDMSATGVVKNVDMKKDSITLSDGKVYILTEGFEAETFKAGEKVAILFHGKGGRLFATSVKQLK